MNDLISTLRSYVQKRDNIPEYTVIAFDLRFKNDSPVKPSTIIGVYVNNYWTLSETIKHNGSDINLLSSYSFFEFLTNNYNLTYIISNIRVATEWTSLTDV